jgi:ABC-type molybdenum transport system ATPase subunit/photorepair protein PhrA
LNCGVSGDTHTDESRGKEVAMDLKESTMSVSADTVVPIVSVRGASCTLGGRKVLDDISLDVMRGQVVVLVGPSGRVRRRCCGRSTISKRSTPVRS